MMVNYFDPEGVTEYPDTLTGAVEAHCDLYNHISAGGYALAESGGKAVLVQEISQLKGVKQ